MLHWLDVMAAHKLLHVGTSKIIRPIWHKKKYEQVNAQGVNDKETSKYLRESNSVKSILQLWYLP